MIKVLNELKTLGGIFLGKPVNSVLQLSSQLKIKDQTQFFSIFLINKSYYFVFLLLLPLNNPSPPAAADFAVAG